MSLKLGKLRREANKVVLEEKSINLLRQELVRSLGPTIVTSYGLKIMAESANDRLDLMEKTGRSPDPVNTSLLIKLSDSSLSEARKLAARLLPERFLERFLRDKDSSVRAATARRLPYVVVKEMVDLHPNDDQLLSIYREKKIVESKKLIDKDSFDMYGDIVMGDAEEVEHPGLTDTWYDTTARKLISSYGNNLERQWEEVAVTRYCDSMKSQGVEVDKQKLLDCVYDHLSTRDNLALEESFDRVNFMPAFDEEIHNPVKELVESNRSPTDYMKLFEKVFNVVKMPMDNPGKKIGIYENFSRITCPAYAVIPTQGLGFLEEKALDTYVRHWTSMQKLSGGSYKMSWAPYSDSKVRFHVGVR